LLTTLAAGCGHGSDPAPRAFVTNEADGTVSVIDLSRLEVNATRPVGDGPTWSQIGLSGETLYVAVAPKGGDGHSIVAMDLETGELIRRLGSGPSPVGFDTIALTIVVANRESDSAAIVDASGGTVRTHVAVGDEPTGVNTAPDDTVWVLCAGANRIDILDTTYAEKVASIDVGARPRQLAFSHDGRRAYVANEADGTVSVIDVRAREVVETIEVPEGAHPLGVAVSLDDTRVFVTTGDGGRLAVIDAASDAVVDTIALPGGQPRNVAIGADGLIYVTSTGTDDLAVIEPTSGAVVARIDVGASPSSISVER